MTLTIGLDVGATKIAAGVVYEDGTIIHRARADTPARDSDGSMRAMVEVAQQLREAHPHVVAVGVSAAGRGPGPGARRTRRRVADAGDLVLKPARKALDASLPATANRPHAELRAAALGNEAAIIGAADLVRTEA